MLSALIAEGPPSRVLEQAIDGRIELLVPEPVLAELQRVLISKLGFAEPAARTARDTIRGLAVECPPAAERVDEVSGDPADDAILASAVEAAADVLVTGDRKHLLPLREHGGVRIMTPQALLSELRGAAP